MIHIAITPNRGDCLGVRGIARDLAAAGLGALKPLREAEPVAGDYDSPVSVQFDLPPDADTACPLFVGRHFHGLTNAESPQWLKDRLTAIGLRPISALVDITNYVTFDLARPLHAFDAGKLTGSTVLARPARDGERLAALDGRTHDLDSGMTVICDGAGPQALGGVMGGVETGVTRGTTEVFLESALFDPVRTAATGRRLGIESDARYRFERGVDPESARWGAEVATRLILEICGGTCSRVVVAGGEPDWRRSCVLRPERVERFGGVSVSVTDMEAILGALGCTVGEHGEGLLVSAPAWRPDIHGEHDVVEEIIRIHGYDTIPAVSLRPEGAVPAAVLTPAQRRAGWVRRTLAVRGLMEAVTYSFLDAPTAALFGGGGDELRLANPISSDLDVMRPSVLPNLVVALGRNAARGQTDGALFEIGPAYDGPAAAEQRLVAGGARQGRAVPRHWAETARPVDAFDAKADALAALAEAGAATDRLQVVAEAPGWYHPGRSGELRLGPGTLLARFGELHPRVLKAMDVKGPVAAFEVFLDAIPEPRRKTGRTARPALAASPFQPVLRDFAFVVEATVPAGAITRAALGADKTLIREARVFDIYEGEHLPEGRKSVAVEVTLQPTERTLTDEKIEAVADAVVKAVEKQTGGVLRG